MRRFVAAVSLVICIVSVFSFTACKTKEEYTDNKSTVNENIIDVTDKITTNPEDIVTTKEIVLSDVLAKINQEFSITEDLVFSIETTDDLELFYNILSADVKQFAAQTAINSATDIDEIILVEAVDSDAAQRVYDALLTRYNSQKDLCASYSAELLAIIEKCSAQKNGNFVTLIMSSEAKAITEYYNSLV